MLGALTSLLRDPTVLEMQDAAAQWPNSVAGLLAYVRDPWRGLGERALAYRWVVAWAESGPNPHLIAVVESWLPIKWEDAPAGSWRDVRGLLSLLPRDHWLSKHLRRRAALGLLGADPRCRKLIAEYLPCESSKQCGFIAKDIAPLVGGRKKYRQLKRQAKSLNLPATFRQLWRGLHDSLDIGHDGRRRRRISHVSLRQTLRTATLRTLDLPGSGKPCHKVTLRSQANLVARALQIEAQGFPCAQEARLINRLWRKMRKQGGLTVVLDVSPTSLVSPAVTARLVALALSINPEALVIGGHAPQSLEVDATNLLESVIAFVNSPGLYTPINLNALPTTIQTATALVLTGNKDLEVHEYSRYVDTSNPWHQDLCMTNPVAYDERKWAEQAYELASSAIQISSISIQSSPCSSQSS